MKKLFSPKKLLGFAPELHWDFMLLIMTAIVIWISVYFSYVYVTLNKYIENAGTTVVATTEEQQSLKKIVNMENVISKYRAKEDTYNSLIAVMARKTPLPATPMSASSTASTTATTSKIVATSTVQ